MLRRIIYYPILSLSIVSMLVLLYAIVNTMVSIKYETVDGIGCVSQVSGKNLCSTITILQALILTLLIIVVGLLLLRKRILAAR